VFPGADDALFRRIRNACSSYVLTWVATNSLLLRTKAHNKSLICKTSDLNERNFIVRCLYKDCHWLLFPQCGSYINVCLLVYLSVLYAIIVITCICQCDSIKKLDDDNNDVYCLLHGLLIPAICASLTYLVRFLCYWPRKPAMTLKSRFRMHQGDWKWHQWIGPMSFPVSHYCNWERNSYRFRAIAFGRSRIALFCYPTCF